MAISSPLLETSINGARGVLINVTGSMDIGLEEVETAANLVQEAAHPDCNIIFGAAFDETLEDEIRVTVIATGFDEKPAAPAAAPAAPAPQAAPAPAPSAAADNFFSAAAAAPVQQPAAAVPPAPPADPVIAEMDDKAAVSNGDWELLERIFSRKK